MAQSCTARLSGSMTIPRHCSWMRPPAHARRVAAVTSDGRVLVGVSDLATDLLNLRGRGRYRIADCWCVSRPAAFRMVSLGRLDVDLSKLRVPYVSPRPPLHGALLRVLAHSGHTGGGVSASFKDRNRGASGNARPPTTSMFRPVPMSGEPERVDPQPRRQKSNP
jgi:hypothetical protein